MKIDPYNTKERYLNWKEKSANKVLNISKENSDLLIRYLNDMETGINVSSGSRKGSRSYLRLYALKNRISFLMRQFEKRFNLNKITDVKEEQLHNFFSNMRKGVIKREDNKEYKSVKDYVKDLKAFWHWHQKVSRKQGTAIDDITIDLDTTGNKPQWVYLTEEQVKQLCDNAKYEYKVLIMFLFDSGIRAPTELINIKVSDLYNNFKELHIREEISKTFGRKIKLMLCSHLLKEYAKGKQLKEDDYLFPINHFVVNRYLKRLAKKILGDEKSPAGENYSNLSMYDFRHCSCCYWLPRYKSESALKYRFGWKKSDKIHYYSELLGMKDTISEEDLLIDLTKTEIEKRLSKTEKDKEIMQEEIDRMREQMKGIFELVSKLSMRVEI